MRISFDKLYKNSNFSKSLCISSNIEDMKKISENFFSLSILKVTFPLSIALYVLCGTRTSGLYVRIFVYPMNLYFLVTLRNQSVFSIKNEYFTKFTNNLSENYKIQALHEVAQLLQHFYFVQIQH